MHRAALVPTILSALGLVAAVRAQEAEPALDDARFRELHAQLTQSEKERWQTVPWQIDLIAAQHLAAEAKKPLFLWAMDGHPLGCT